MNFPNLKAALINSQIWRSIFRSGIWKDTPRDRAGHVIGNLWLHLHPVRIRPRALQWTYTWGLGGISFLLFLILTVTGVFLMFYYRPTMELAYRDMKDLEFAITLGKLLRNSHRWAAQAMLVAVILHMIRVYLTGAYKKPREFNWCIGVLLLTLTLFLSFTGYLLPWDQLDIWAVTVGTNLAAATPFLGYEGPFSSLLGVHVANDVRFVLLGGTVVGENTLLRFYVLHCVFVPLVAGALIMLHFWRIRKDSFSAAPLALPGPRSSAEGAAAPLSSASDEEKVEVWPHLVLREYVAAGFTVLFILLWSILQNAPLEELANPTVTPNPSKAPWYFVGLQELLRYFDPWIAGVMIPNLIIVGLMAIPYVNPNPKGVGYYAWRESPFAIATFLFGILLWFVLIFIGYFCRGPNFAWYWPWESWLVHKAPPPPTWDLPLWAGALLLLFYFGFGILGPRFLQREISFKPAVIFYWIFAAAAGAAIYLFGFTAGQVAALFFFLFVYYLFGFLMPQRYLRDLSWPRYLTAMVFLLMMVGVVLKIGAMVGFNLHYILALPQYNFNI
ncbi:MAG: cytochrome b N-terminal domain-containing protein [Elusimicrobia bacterium]|nr:cytochrome b N-terminal domain-containing protein [Elusimicrobiota bacterium]